jgi:type IV secretion system protein VirB3
VGRNANDEGGGIGAAPGTSVLPDGYRVPVHRSLSDPILMGGAPRSLAISIGTLAAALGIGLQLFVPGILIWVLGHGAAVRAAKRDPDFVPVATRHLKHRPFLGT